MSKCPVQLYNETFKLFEEEVRNHTNLGNHVIHLKNTINNLMNHFSKDFVEDIENRSFKWEEIDLININQDLTEYIIRDILTKVVECMRHIDLHLGK